jgi:hypothetical protein
MAARAVMRRQIKDDPPGCGCGYGQAALVRIGR